jgi:oligopeptide transport system substrate-binding protein
MRIQLSHEPISLDPTLAEDGVSLQVLSNLWDGLLAYDPSGALIKKLAQSYDVSADGKRIRFVLRPGIAWSDGQPIAARDFVTAFRRTLSPKTLCKLAPMYFAIRGAKLYHQGQGSWQNVGIRSGKGKLEFELEYPAPSLLHALALPPALPLRQEILDQNQGKWPESAPTTGSYFISRHQVDQSIFLSSNSHYWDRSGRNSEIELLIVADESTGAKLFEQGKLDILTRIPAMDLNRFKKRGQKAITVRTDPLLATYYLSFNCKVPPFNRAQWRRAVAGVIRRDEIAEFLGGGEMPALSWVPPGLDGYLPYVDPQPLFADAVREVKREVKREGLKTRKISKGMQLSLAFDAGERNSKILEKIQQDLLSQLGMQTSLVSMDWKAYNQWVMAGPPSLYRYGWLSPVMDPIAHLKAFTTGNPNNYSGCSNLNYDRLVREIEQMPVSAARHQKILLAQKILLEKEAMVVPIYHYVQNTAVAERVGGFEITPFGVIRFQKLFLLKK